MDLTGHVHLLLGAPGQAVSTLPDSAWRVTVWGSAGMADPASVASSARLTPMTPRGERTLVSAVASDDVDTIARLCEQAGPLQEAARVLYAARLVAMDPEAAAAVLGHLLAAPTDPAQSKILRRHWPNLHFATAIAPSVPALVPVSKVGAGLLLAEVRASQGRMADAIVVLSQLPPQPAVHLAMAAGLLATGEHARVLDITNRLRNVDDLSALGLIARSVAARTLGDVPGALDAVCGALSTTERSPGVLAAALEERAHLYSLLQDDIAARADLDCLALLAGGAQQVSVPEPARVRRPGEERREEHSLDRARDRMRRRIMGVGEPGTFGGRHHSTYRDEIAEMFALGKLAAVEELLLGLLDAVEDEVSELGVALDPTFFLTLADLYQDSGRHEDLVALRERFAAAEARAAQTAPTAVDEVVEAALVVPQIERAPLGDPTLQTPPAPAPPENPFAAPARVSPLRPERPAEPAPVAPAAAQPAPTPVAASLAPQTRPAPPAEPVVVPAPAAFAPVEAPPVAAPSEAVEPGPVADETAAPTSPRPAPDASVPVPPVEPAVAEETEPDLATAAPVAAAVGAAPAGPDLAAAGAVVGHGSSDATASAAAEALSTVETVVIPAAPVVPEHPEPETIAEPLVAGGSADPTPAGAVAVAVTEAPPPSLGAGAAPAGEGSPVPPSEPALPPRVRDDGRTSLIALASAPVTPLTPSAKAAAAAAAKAAAADAESDHELTPVERAIRGPRLRSL